MSIFCILQDVKQKIHVRCGVLSFQDIQSIKEKPEASLQEVLVDGKNPATKQVDVGEFAKCFVSPKNNGPTQRYLSNRCGANCPDFGVHKVSTDIKRMKLGGEPNDPASFLGAV